MPTPPRWGGELPLFAEPAAAAAPEADTVPAARSAGAEAKVYGVGELARRIRDVVEDGFPGVVTVEGEISNLRPYASGHIYFTLKDAEAQLNAVWFRGSQTAFARTMADGARVRATGEVRVYEQRSQYQIIVRSVREAGRGALFEALEKLKAKLAAEGLFDDARKRPLPVLPRCVGVATSPSGAALRDILHVTRRRFPSMRVMIAPCRVQGIGAAEMIAGAIDRLGSTPGVDVIIAGRGGGSIEDLWAFNEEAVVRAIVRAPVPVISAVGHETDFTLADFAADRRAPTPSAAAEMAVPVRSDLDARLDEAGDRLRRAIAHALVERRGRIRARATDIAAALRSRLARTRQRIDDVQLRVRDGLTGAAARARRRIDRCDEIRLARAAERRVHERRQHVDRLRGHLGALNPLAVLDRGYSITRTPDGALVRSTADVAAGARISTQVRDGRFDSTVLPTDGHGPNGAPSSAEPVKNGSNELPAPNNMP